jgi:hypothetical protein
MADESGKADLRDEPAAIAEGDTCDPADDDMADESGQRGPFMQSA